MSMMIMIEITHYKDRRGYYYKTIDNDTVHLTRYTGQQAIDFIDKNATNNKPFCLSLSFSAPHAHDGAPEQYFWQAETDKLLENTTIPGPELADDKYFEHNLKLFETVLTDCVGPGVTIPQKNTNTV